MRYLNSYEIIKESVAEAKSFWTKYVGDDTDNFMLHCVISSKKVQELAGKSYEELERDYLK